MTARAEVEEIMACALREPVVLTDDECEALFQAEQRRATADNWIRPSGKGVRTEYEELIDELAGNKPSHTPWVVAGVCILALAVVVALALR